MNYADTGLGEAVEERLDGLFSTVRPDEYLKIDGVSVPFEVAQFGPKSAQRRAPEAQK